jgi:hypothetical protein
MKKETGTVVDNTLISNALFSIVFGSFSTFSYGRISEVEFLDKI